LLSRPEVWQNCSDRSCIGTKGPRVLHIPPNLFSWAVVSMTSDITIQARTSGGIIIDSRLEVDADAAAGVQRLSAFDGVSEYDNVNEWSAVRLDTKVPEIAGVGVRTWTFGPGVTPRCDKFHALPG
jgi:hypothetical protein